MSDVTYVPYAEHLNFLQPDRLFTSKIVGYDQRLKTQTSIIQSSDGQTTRLLRETRPAILWLAL